MRTCIERRLQETVSGRAAEVVKMPAIVKRYYAAGVVAGAGNPSAL
jgi:hypothetical protein